MPHYRPVYETGKGRLCHTCGEPLADCRCGSPEEEAVPTRVSCVLRLERRGRGGKTVTVVSGLPRNRSFLAALAAELKRECGSGGRAAEAEVEIQGDQRERLRPLLLRRGFVVKG